MKIVDFELILVGTPWRELLFVELTTDDGLVGVGECRMVNKTQTLVAGVQELGQRYVLGLDPFDIGRLTWEIQRGEYGRPGEIAQSALACFEVACHDIQGQALGVPVWKLLGGKFRDRVPAYANGWYQVEHTPEAIATAALGVLDAGYRAMKIDPFGAASAWLEQPERVHAADVMGALRRAVGDDVELFVEMHGRFSPREAVLAAEMLAEYRPGWIEEPTPPENAAALRAVRSGTNLPIATGERLHTLHDAREFFDLGVVDIVQVDLTHFGGLRPMQVLAGWADVHYLHLAPHNVCGPVGTMAALHLGIATPNFRILEHFNDFADPWVQHLVDYPPEVVEGYFQVPERPGLGLRLDRDACAEHPSTGGRIQLFKEGWERRQSSPAEQHR